MVDYNHRLKVAKEQAVTTGFATQEMLKDKDFREFYNEMLTKTWEQYKKMKK